MNKVNFTSSKRIVIKIGSSIITKNGDGIDNVQLKSIVEQIAKLVAKKKEIVLNCKCKIMRHGVLIRAIPDLATRLWRAR